MAELSTPPDHRRSDSGRLWSRHFTLATLTNLCLTMVFYLPVTTMALYAVERFQASDVESGLAVSAFVVGSVVARLITGQAMDLVGRRRSLRFALLVLLVATVAYLFADSLWLLVAVRAVHGVAFGAANTILAASVVAFIPPRRVSEGTGWFGTSATISAALGPLLALYLTADGDYDVLFLVATGIAAAAVSVGLFVGPQK